MQAESLLPLHSLLRMIKDVIIDNKEVEKTCFLILATESSKAIAI